MPEQALKDRSDSILFMRRSRFRGARRPYAFSNTPEAKKADEGKGIYELMVEGLLLKLPIRFTKEDVQKLPSLAFQGATLSELPDVGDEIKAHSKPVAFINPASYPYMDGKKLLDFVFSPGTSSVGACIRHAAGHSFNAVVRENFERLEEKDYPAILIARLTDYPQKIEHATKLAPGNDEIQEILDNTRSQIGDDASWMSRAALVFSRESQISLVKKVLAELERLAGLGIQV